MGNLKEIYVHPWLKYSFEKQVMIQRATLEEVIDRELESLKKIGVKVKVIYPKSFYSPEKVN